jgi:putative ABC transport system substrate-binding protein
MRRREFIGFVSCATLACSLRVHAQEAGVSIASHWLCRGTRRAGGPRLSRRVAGAGFVEGKNLAIVGGQPTSNEQVPTVVPLIPSGSTGCHCEWWRRYRARLPEATQSIPIIVMDRRYGCRWICHLIGRPGGNATGISLMSPDLDGKRQDVLIEAVPGARRIAALADSNVASLEHLKALEASARKHGKELVIVRAASASDLAPAISEAGKQAQAALNVLSSPMLHLNRGSSLRGRRRRDCRRFISGRKQRKKAVCSLMVRASSIFSGSALACRQGAARRQAQRVADRAANQVQARDQSENG